MRLRNKIKITSKYKGSSKFPFFKDLQIDDIIEVSLEVGRSFRGPNGLYATYVILFNTRTKYELEVSLTMLSRYLTHFEFIEVDD